MPATSVLERVSGPLADVLAGSSDGERILQDLEQAGAFVVSLDGRRSWFRYHRLFADLLQLELRRTEPNERAALHGAAAAWLAGHGHDFAGYAEELPAAGSPVCSAGGYARKHVPWTDFSNVPATANQPFTSWPTADYGRLPTPRPAPRCWGEDSDSK